MAVKTILQLVLGFGLVASLLAFVFQKQLANFFGRSQGRRSLNRTDLDDEE